MVKEDQQELRTLNRLYELLTPWNKEEVIKMAAITRSAMRRRREPELLQEEVIQRIRIERIKQAQEEEVWIRNLKLYLTGDPAQLSAAEAKIAACIAPDYNVDESGLLFFCPRSAAVNDRMGMMRLIIPELLQKDFLHHFHTSV